MAFAATMHWDVRTTGNNANGGGFDPTSGTPGTDFSQQDAAQIAYTDLVIDGTTNTKCTSAGNPFTAAHVGNVINITGGTGFTVQRVQIMSVAAGVATVDKSLGTLSSTGGTGNLGGGLLTVAQAMTLTTVAGMTIDVKSGTYTVTASQTLPAVQFVIRGYGTTHGDGGTRPIYQLGTSNNANMFNNASGTSMWADNMTFNFTGATSNQVIMFNAGNTGYLFLTGCSCDGNSLNGSGNGRVSCIIDNGGNWQYVLCDNCSFTNWWQASAGGDSFVIATNYSVHVQNCYFGTFGRGISNGAGNTNAPEVRVENCIFNLVRDTCMYDIRDPGTPRNPVTWIVRYNACFSASPANNFGLRSVGAFTDTNTQSVNSNLVHEGNIYYGLKNGVSLNENSGAGAQPPIVNRNNAYGNNTVDVVKFTKSASDITLTANPWTNTATPDFSLNSTAGGGALLKNVGFPGALQQGGTGFADVGPLRHQDPAGGTTTIPISVMQTRFVTEGEYA